ncbi:MAG TPA: hypothetical protein VGP35_13870 [Terriglobales bacterium]|nr:hypothetical protein [Terriglobales bacterium]
MNKRCTCSVIFLMACFATSVFAQEDFSANVVNQRAGKNTTNTQTKLYVTKDKMRIDSNEANGHGGSVIVNFTKQTNVVLMPERKMYMEFPQGQGPGAQRLQGLFRVGDAENACEEWPKLTNKPGTKCRKIGSDTVNGRSTVKYEATSENGKSGNFWIDPKIRFPVKWQDTGSDGNSGELQDIKEGSQPASLFEIPSDYQKFQMPAGMGDMPHRQ